jgi:hypothetical protein
LPEKSSANLQVTNNFGAILHANFQLADTMHPAKPAKQYLIATPQQDLRPLPPSRKTMGFGEGNNLRSSTYADASFAAQFPPYL